MIAIGVGVIGYFQWRTNQNKLKLDLFQKRYVLYQATKAFLGIILRDGKCTNADVFTYSVNVQDKEFLFDNELSSYLEELRKRGLRMAALTNELQRMHAGPDRNALVDEEDKLLGWLIDQRHQIAAKFASHLKLSH